MRMCVCVCVCALVLAGARAVHGLYLSDVRACACMRTCMAVCAICARSRCISVDLSFVRARLCVHVRVRVCVNVCVCELCVHVRVRACPGLQVVCMIA